MIEIIANKHAFDGKDVQVRGYLSVRFEDHALYFDDTAYGLTTTENALWVAFDDSEKEKFEKYDRHWGYVTGTFKLKDCNGHLCLYGGTIEHAKLGMMFKDK